jgi:hypothetical protein
MKYAQLGHRGVLRIPETELLKMSPDLLEGSALTEARERETYTIGVGSVQVLLMFFYAQPSTLLESRRTLLTDMAITYIKVVQ